MAWYVLGGLGGSEIEVVGCVHPRNDVTSASTTSQISRFAVNLYIQKNNIYLMRYL